MKELEDLRQHLPACVMIEQLLSLGQTFNPLETGGGFLSTYCKKMQFGCQVSKNCSCTWVKMAVWENSSLEEARTKSSQCFTLKK